MPLNGRANQVSKPSWLKDTTSTPAAATSTPAPMTTTSRPWVRKTSDATAAVKKADEVDAKKEESQPKKEVSAKLQSREIKVPLKVEKTIKPTPILKKPVEEKKEEVKVLDKKPPTKLSANKSPSTTPSKTSTPSKSPTPIKSTPSSKTPSKSPSKTPETYDDSDEDSSEEEEEEEETETETESDSEEEDDDEIDSDLDFSDNEPYRPPSPVNAKQKLVIPTLRKVKKSPEQSAEQSERSQSPEFAFKKPELRKVVTKQKSEVRERTPSPEPKFIKPKLRKVPSSLRTKDFKREKLPVVELKKAPSKQLEFGDTKKSMDQFPLKPSILRAESNKKIPLPPPPPPPPPPPGLTPPPDFSKKPISEKHKETIERLKSRPRRRPDWSEMMKEVESGRKLRHVQCNDRSSPIVTCKSLTKVKGQYIFETEKKNTALDNLLYEIQSGIKLKPTRTNDRSRPVLDGLRKFRRQMTIEEQIQKSESKAVCNLESAPSQVPVPDEGVDELDDIDRVRDDLQSTKQMLALELRNKEAQERENKRLLAKIANLEAELEREKSSRTASRSGSVSCSEDPTPISNGTEDALIKNLKKESEELLKTSKQLEKKYQDAAEQLDNAYKQIEEQKRLIASLEKKNQGVGGDFDSRRQSEVNNQKESSPEMEIVMSEEEEDESEEKKAERAARRLKREVDMLGSKLSRLKEKEMNARNERKSLRDAMKKNQQILKDEKKKFKKLQKEVEKMAAMMKGIEDECSDEEAEEKEEAEEEEEQSEESENESDESDSESESETESQSEDEDAEDQKKKENLEPRVKRHDGRLSSLKKGNYLLEANVERIKDEIKEHKEKCGALQADLDSVIDLC